MSYLPRIGRDKKNVHARTSGGGSEVDIGVCTKVRQGSQQVAKAVLAEVYWKQNGCKFFEGKIKHILKRTCEHCITFIADNRVREDKFSHYYQEKE